MRTGVVLLHFYQGSQLLYSCYSNHIPRTDDYIAEGNVKVGRVVWHFEQDSFKHHRTLSFIEVNLL